jgi:hypothetical protein
MHGVTAVEWPELKLDIWELLALFTTRGFN